MSKLNTIACTSIFVLFAMITNESCGQHSNHQHSGFSLGGPFGVVIGGGRGLRIGGPDGVQFGGGHGAQFGGPGGVQFGGGQLMRVGPGQFQTTQPQGALGAGNRYQPTPAGSQLVPSNANLGVHHQLSDQRQIPHPRPTASATQGALNMVTIHLPESATESVHMEINGQATEIFPGETLELDGAQGVVVRMHTKNRLAISRSLAPGNYSLQSTRRGWALFQTRSHSPARPAAPKPAVENNGHLHSVLVPSSTAKDSGTPNTTQPSINAPQPNRN